MIGFPLRLLAREIYDRIARIKGNATVALVTGEEKIVPPGARFSSARSRAMPLDRRSPFLAIDEIQLCADPERGHVFTDRLLHARGETRRMFLGAETMRPLLRRFVPEAEFISRPRFPTLSYTGRAKLTRLPAARRSSPSRPPSLCAGRAGPPPARRRRRCAGRPQPAHPQCPGGALPVRRGRFLVATDAIGMGLNMDVDHVAFAALEQIRRPRRRVRSKPRKSDRSPAAPAAT